MRSQKEPSRISRWLASLPLPFLMSFAAASAFSTYFCMYAFRKPFSAATYEGLRFLGADIDLKTAFVVSQILGYAISKVIGIKVCSEARRAQRTPLLVGMILVAQLSLLLFAILPNNLKVLAIFLNGLPLGMIWGLVVCYLEGRRTSEMLLAALSCSFILASGVVKDVGRWLMSSWQVDQFWMPFTAGMLFLPPFLLSVWMLDQVPQPTDEDVDARVERTTMDQQQRRQFARQFLLGLALLLITYFFLTAYRDFRDNFGAEIFAQLGYGETETALFTRCELWVAFGVLGSLALLSLIKSNQLGLVGAFVVMTSGVMMMGFGTLLHDAGRISGLTWMVLCGLGSYLAYVPYGSVLFDRLIASTRAVGTAVFAIYVADSIGYAGAIGVLLSKDLIAGDLSRLDFFRYLTYFMSVFGTAMLVASCAYFVVISSRSPSAATQEHPS